MIIIDVIDSPIDDDDDDNDIVDDTQPSPDLKSIALSLHLVLFCSGIRRD